MTVVQVPVKVPLCGVRFAVGHLASRRMYVCNRVAGHTGDHAVLPWSDR